MIFIGHIQAKQIVQRPGFKRCHRARNHRSFALLTLSLSRITFAVPSRPLFDQHPCLEIASCVVC